MLESRGAYYKDELSFCHDWHWQSEVALSIMIAICDFMVIDVHVKRYTIYLKKRLLYFLNNSKKSTSYNNFWYTTFRTFRRNSCQKL